MIKSYTITVLMVVSLTMTIGVMIIDDVDNSEDDDKDDND